MKVAHERLLELAGLPPVPMSAQSKKSDDSKHGSHNVSSRPHGDNTLLPGSLPADGGDDATKPGIGTNELEFEVDRQFLCEVLLQKEQDQQGE
jgi:hypothetical protein